MSSSPFVNLTISELEVFIAEEDTVGIIPATKIKSAHYVPAKILRELNPL